MTFRFLLLATLFFVSGCLCSRPESSENSSLNSNKVHLAIWSSYINSELLKEFEEQSGLQVSVSNYSSNEELLAKLQAGATGIDVAVPSDYMVAAMIGLQLLQPLEKKDLPVIQEMDPQVLKRSYDPQNEFSLPYSYTFTGIAFDRKQLTTPPKSWHDLFYQDDLKGRFSLLDDGRETLGAALKYQGHSYNSADPSAISSARDLLIAVKPRVKSFVSEPNDALLHGELAAAHAYSSDALQVSQKRAGEVDFIIPTEGTTMAIDNLVIPKGSTNVSGAHQLIQFLLSPKANAVFVGQVFGGPVNLGTRALLSEDLRNHPVLFPSKNVIESAEMMQDLGELSTFYDRMWTEVKAAM
jgi:spermidine/putrescine transport system substrate-binding protein